MSFDDFCTHFTDLTLCRIIHSTSITGNYWREQHVFGSWVFHDDPELNTTGGSFEKHPVFEPLINYFDKTFSI